MTKLEPQTLPAMTDLSQICDAIGLDSRRQGGAVHPNVLDGFAVALFWHDLLFWLPARVAQERNRPIILDVARASVAPCRVEGMTSFPRMLARCMLFAAAMAASFDDPLAQWLDSLKFSLQDVAWQTSSAKCSFGGFGSVVLIAVSTGSPMTHFDFDSFRKNSLVCALFTCHLCEGRLSCEAH